MDKLREYVGRVQDGKAENLDIFIMLSGSGLLIGKVHIKTEESQKLINTEKDFWLKDALAVTPSLFPLVLAQVSYEHVAAWGFAKAITESLEHAQGNS